MEVWALKLYFFTHPPEDWKKKKKKKKKVRKALGRDVLKVDPFGTDTIPAVETSTMDNRFRVMSYAPLYTVKEEPQNYYMHLYHTTVAVAWVAFALPSAKKKQYALVSSCHANGRSLHVKPTPTYSCAGHFSGRVKSDHSVGWMSSRSAQ